MSDDNFPPAFGSPITPWHRWFAWRPVDTIDRGWQWFRIMRRRRIQKHLYLPGPAAFWWQYAVEPNRLEAPHV